MDQVKQFHGRATAGEFCEVSSNVGSARYDPAGIRTTPRSKLIERVTPLSIMVIAKQNVVEPTYRPNFDHSCRKNAKNRLGNYSDCRQPDPAAV
jgi:hypothetical protein